MVKVVKKSQDEFNAFKTKAGRTVYDGGGVLPDIEIEETKSATITDAVVKSDAIFNFATQWYYKNPTISGIPTITDIDYAAFKTFLKQEKITLDTETNKALKNVLETAKRKNGYSNCCRIQAIGVGHRTKSRIRIGQKQEPNQKTDSGRFNYTLPISRRFISILHKRKLRN